MHQNIVKEQYLKPFLFHCLGNEEYFFLLGVDGSENIWSSLYDDCGEFAWYLFDCSLLWLVSLRELVNESHEFNFDAK